LARTPALTWHKSAKEILGRLTYDYRLADGYEHEPR
jgi:hypothetical protein